ncbi:hypothetical protein [Actinocrispum sp. NPDC049592]|uniref:hypothetical protein n=1 Tax=Actinocrispum sp. NPDC049592 TaxID=3154835 RepID=UPI003418E25B
MIDRREQAALLLALRADEHPWAEVARLVEESGSALAILEQLTSPAAPTLDHTPMDLDASLEAAEAEIAEWADEGITLGPCSMRPIPHSC